MILLNGFMVCMTVKKNLEFLNIKSVFKNEKTLSLKERLLY